MDYTVFVAKNGDDTTADGSVGKPFLTVQAAMDYAYVTYVLPVLPADVTRRPTVFVNAGTYNDGDLVLPPQINVMGEGYNHTRIGGNWTLDARWTPPGDFRSKMSDFSCLGNVTLDWNAFASNEGKFFARDVRFSGAVDIVEFSRINQEIFHTCEFFGVVTLTGTNATFNACRTPSNGSFVLNQKAALNASNTFLSSGGTIGPITINALSAGSARYNVTLDHLALPGAPLVVNGAFSDVRASIASLPLQTLVTLTGGANLNQISRINQPNFSGVTLDRPPAPYVGQQFFDTTLGKPVWWNGTAWITWSDGTLLKFSGAVDVNSTPITTLADTGNANAGGTDVLNGATFATNYPFPVEGVLTAFRVNVQTASPLTDTVSVQLVVNSTVVATLVFVTEGQQSAVFPPFPVVLGDVINVQVDITGGPSMYILISAMAQVLPA